MDEVVFQRFVDGDDAAFTFIYILIGGALAK